MEPFASLIDTPSGATKITPTMIRAGRDALLASFPEDVLSERTAGLDQAVCDIYRAMQERKVASLMTVEKLAMTICEAVDGPCICALRERPSPDENFDGCRIAIEGARAAWPHIELVCRGFQSLGVRPDA